MALWGGEMGSGMNGANLSASAPTALHSSAQGNALGYDADTTAALKGHHNARARVTPLQGFSDDGWSRYPGWGHWGAIGGPLVAIGVGSQEVVAQQ